MIFAEAYRRGLVILLAAVLLGALALPGFAVDARKPRGTAADSWAVGSQPVALVNGSPVVFHVTSPQPLKSLSGKWLEHAVFFASDPEGENWYGIAGAS